MIAHNIKGRLFQGYRLVLSKLNINHIFMPARISKTCIIEGENGNYHFSIQVEPDKKITLFEEKSDFNDTTGFYVSLTDKDWEVVKEFVDNQLKSIKPSK